VAFVGKSRLLVCEISERKILSSGRFYLCYKKEEKLGNLAGNFMGQRDFEEGFDQEDRPRRLSEYLDRQVDHGSKVYEAVDENGGGECGTSPGTVYTRDKKLEWAVGE
jgi:hypothetical protein